MKAILICPAERPGVKKLYERMPLALVPLLGRNLIDLWMDHLVTLNCTDVMILTADRAELVRRHVSEGERWGIHAEVCPTTRELTAGEALRLVGNIDGLECVEIIDFLPLRPDRKLFSDYATWFETLLLLIPGAGGESRLGAREVRPGVWAGMHTKIAAHAELVGPCWIGNDVKVGAQTVIGPYAILEDRVCVEEGAGIVQSIILPETLVGEWTHIRDTIAGADTLVRIHDGASTRVKDRFLLSALDEGDGAVRLASLGGQAVALVLLAMIAPFAGIAMIRLALAGDDYLKKKTVVRPGRHLTDRTRETGEYYYVPSRYRWIRRWPQLWEVVCGRFALVGNRPLTPRQASELEREFERLWLTVPTGVISLADVEVGIELYGEKAKVHACFYAVKSDWKLDCKVFYHVVLVQTLRGLRLLVGSRVQVSAVYADLDGRS